MADRGAFVVKTNMFNQFVKESIDKKMLIESIPQHLDSKRTLKLEKQIDYISMAKR